jgi:putative transposase
MISTPDRQTAIALIDDAVTAGARRAKACCELEISERTLRRWTKDGEVRPDQRPVVPRPQPANALSAAERAAVLDVCNSKEFSRAGCVQSNSRCTPNAFASAIAASGCNGNVLVQ